YLITALDGATTGNALILWDMTTGQAVAEANLPPAGEAVWGMALDETGGMVALGQGASVKIWERKSQTWLHSFTTPLSAAELHFSPDGRSLAGVGETSTGILVWALQGSSPTEPVQITTPTAILSFAFSADSRQLSTFSTDGAVQVWENTGREVVAHLSAEQMGSLKDFTFVDEQRLLTASTKGIRMWQTATGQPLELKLEGMPTDTFMQAVALSPDRKYLAAGGEYNAIWDFSTGRLVKSLQADSLLQAGAFSPDGRYVATLSENGELRVDDFARQLPLVRSMGNRAKLIAISTPMSLPDFLLATAEDNNLVRVRRLSSRSDSSQPEVKITLNEEVTALQFSIDRQQLVIAAGNVVQVWETATGKPVGKPMVHENRVNALALGGPIGNYVATASRDQTARLWNLSTGEPIGEPLQHEGSVEAITFSTDGKLFATASGKVGKVWSVATREPVGVPLHSEKKIRSLALRGTAELMILDEEGTAQGWQFATGKPRPAPPINISAASKVAFFSTTGSTLLAGSRFLSVWSITTGRMTRQLTNGKILTSLAFSPDSKYLMTTPEDKSLQLLEVGSWKVIETPITDGDFGAITFSPNGKKLFWTVTETEEGKAEKTVGAIKSWDMTTEEEQTFIREKGEAATALATSPDGNLLVTADDDSVQVWDAKTRERDGKDIMQTGGIKRLVFDRDGHLLIDGNELAIWDLNSRQKQVRLAIDGVRSDFNPDGKYLVTGGANGISVRWWRPQEMIESACGRMVRNLSLREWEYYMGTADYQKTCGLPFDPETLAEFITEGIDAAQEGKLKRAEEIFQFLNRQDSTLGIDPPVEARWHFEKGQRETEYMRLLERLKPGEQALKKADLEELQRASQQLLNFYQRPHKFNPQDILEPDDYNLLNQTCWDGARAEFSHQVLPVCELMIQIVPDNQDYRDSRGLARARTGNIQGAIEDFQYFADRTDNKDRSEQRLNWIKELRAGRNPFTKEELEKLRDQ
ncbi:MAG TPA: hypothetical protein VFZ34_15370, partial [Blastocatellia bacterium]|nr:hypothetical protein [Blastocatellia bacterium]